MYAQVKNGSITTFDSLPFRVTLADGTTRTSLTELSATQLAEIGVYPVVGTAPEHDPSTQRLVGPSLALDGDHVTATWTVESLSAEEIAGKLAAAMATKIAELRQAAYAESQEGVLTTPGLRMKYGEQDCVLVDGVVRYAELKGLSIVPKFIEADGTIHTNVTLVDGQTIRLEQFEAAYAADERLRALAAQVQAATSVAEVEAVSWSQP